MVNYNVSGLAGERSDSSSSSPTSTACGEVDVDKVVTSEDGEDDNVRNEDFSSSSSSAFSKNAGSSATGDVLDVEGEGSEESLSSSPTSGSSLSRSDENEKIEEGSSLEEPRRSNRIVRRQRKSGVSTPSKNSDKRINGDGRASKKRKVTKGFTWVSDDPNDLLKDAPPVPTRPRYKGEIIGDILYYGDSITWGMGHNFTGRYAVPWPRHLESRLQKEYGLRTVEAALCSRTTVHDDPWEGNKEWMCGSEPHTFNGLTNFTATFNSHMPKWLILMLGTNDLKTRIRAEAGRRVTASVIAENCASLAEKAREMYDGHSHEGRLKILVVVPPEVRITPLSIEMGYDEVSVRISKSFHKAYREMCRKHDLICVFPEIDMTKSVDGVHVTEEANKIISDAVWETLEMELPRKVRHRSSKNASSSKNRRSSRASASSAAAHDDMVYY